MGRVIRRVLAILALATSCAWGGEESARPRFVATVSGENIHLRDTVEDREVRVFPGLKGLTAAAVSCDGKVLVSGHADGSIHLWDPKTGKETREFTPDNALGVRSLRFVPGGRFLAAVDVEGREGLWDLLADILKENLDQSKAVLKDEELEPLWVSLLGPDGAQAVRTLAASPASAVPFLKSHLIPAKEDTAALEKLIRDLDDNDYDVREKASVTLAKLGPLAEPWLRKAREESTSEEVRSRAGALLEGLSRDASVLEGEDLRISRALQLLELIGTAEAREVLETMASGAPGARETRQAKAALERMK